MKLQLTESEVTHLRKTLAWMRCEYCLDEDMQRGCLSAVKKMLDNGDISQDRAEDAVIKRAEQINQVPKYIRHAIKMLTKAVRQHDSEKGEIVDGETRFVQIIVNQEGK